MNPSCINFLIIGAAKAATTSLAKWLEQTPDCCLSNPKETMFFGSEKRHKNGLEWYWKTYYPHFKGEPLVGEATPAYSDRTRCPKTVEWVYDHNPDMHIIYMVRNPMDRCISAWKMWASLNETGWPFSDHLTRMAKKGFTCWLKDPAVYEHIMETSRYDWQWKAWKRFPCKQRLVLFMQDLKVDKKGFLRTVADFLGIDSNNLIKVSNVSHNTVTTRAQKTALREWLEQKPAWKSLKGYIPQNLKSTIAESRFWAKQLGHIDPKWDRELMEKFLEDIRSDNEQFLKSNGKPADYWHSL